LIFLNINKELHLFLSFVLFDGKVTNPARAGQEKSLPDRPGRKASTHKAHRISTAVETDFSGQPACPVGRRFFD
jgi:hypothetical protein